jgi:hypothetical protein
MVRLLYAAVLASLLGAPALAETHKIPNDNPIVTVDVPDKGWTASKIDRGIEVSDDDDEVYLAIEGMEMKDIPTMVKDAIGYLARGGVRIDTSTEKKVDGKLGNFDVYDIGWEGKDQDGDVLVHLTIVRITRERGVLFTYWASPTGDKENDEAITKMVKSIRQVGR